MAEDSTDAFAAMSNTDDVLEKLFEESMDIGEDLSGAPSDDRSAANPAGLLSSETAFVASDELRSRNAASSGERQATEVSQRTWVDESAVVYTRSLQELALQQIIGILQNPDKQFVSSVPPSKPRHGDVYVFAPDVDKTTRRCDFYHWITDGAKKMPRRNPIIKKHYFKAKTAAGSKTDEFRKHEYELLAKSTDSNGNRCVLVQYVGNSAVANYTATHGNRLHAGAAYIRTSGTVKNVIQANADKSPKKQYRNLLTTIKCPGSAEAVMKPGNSHQVKNFQKAARDTRRISHDGLYNCLEIALQFPDYVHFIQAYPQLIIHIGDSSLFSELDKLFHTLNKEGSPTPQLQYDTTFLLGDFYVSALSFRHEVFEGSPVIPPAFMIHEHKFKKDHERSMEATRERSRYLKTKPFVLVTDSEFAFSEVFPNATCLYCWNHIKNNVRNWLRQRQASSDDLRVYSNHVLQLLQSDSASIFEIAFDTLSRSWSEDVLEYFKDYIKPKIEKFAGKWIVSGAGCYDSISGITTNAAESLNCVLKKLQQWKERPVDALIVSLKYLQSFYCREIQRGFHGIGDYCVRHCYGDVLEPANLLPSDDDRKLPEEIVEYVKTGLANVLPPNEDSADESSGKSEQIGHFSSAEVLAKHAVETNKVVFVPSLKSFLVEGSNATKYAVTLFPKESCQCPSVRTCYHILAAKALMGVPLTHKKTVLNLSQLRKRHIRGRNKASGRKNHDLEIMMLSLPLTPLSMWIKHWEKKILRI